MDATSEESQFRLVENTRLKPPFLLDNWPLTKRLDLEKVADLDSDSFLGEFNVDYGKTRRGRRSGYAALVVKASDRSTTLWGRYIFRGDNHSGASRAYQRAYSLSDKIQRLFNDS